MLKRTIRLHLYKIRKYRRELKSHIRGEIPLPCRINIEHVTRDIHDMSKSKIARELILHCALFICK